MLVRTSSTVYARLSTNFSSREHVPVCEHTQRCQPTGAQASCDARSEHAYAAAVCSFCIGTIRSVTFCNFQLEEPAALDWYSTDVLVHGILLGFTTRHSTDTHIPWCICSRAAVGRYQALHSLIANSQTPQSKTLPAVTSVLEAAYDVECRPSVPL